jgi:hypothetical protein
MAQIPHRDEIHHLIESVTYPEEDRMYLGMSSIGHPCDRYLFYVFHWAFHRKIYAKQKRLFNRGHLEEQIVISDLAAANIHTVLQQDEVTDKTGHIRGHIDGVILSIPEIYPDTRLLLEVKTMGDKFFKVYKKKKLPNVEPGYYAQMNQYMGYKNLSKCLFVVTNKNTEERDYTVYDFDKINFLDYQRRSIHLLMSDRIPERIGNSTWFECKMCDAKQICHFKQPIRQHCRTCKHIEIHDKGIWKCGITAHSLNFAEQQKGCEYWIKSPTLVD